MDTNVRLIPKISLSERAIVDNEVDEGGMDGCTLSC
jgi:hypothetical protein